MDKDKLVVQVLAEESSQNEVTSSDESLAPIDSGTDGGDSDFRNTGTTLLRKPLSPITKSYKDKKFPCKQCGSQFTKKLDMHIHRLTHSEISESGEKVDSSVETASRPEEGLDLTVRKNVTETLKSDLERPLKTSNTRDEGDRDPQDQLDKPSSDQTSNEIDMEVEHHSNNNEAIEELSTNDNNSDEDIDVLKSASQDYQDMLSRILSDASHSKYHLDIIVPTSSKRTYQCGPCNKKFSDYSLYLHHREDHPNPKLFKCSVCSKSFTIKGNLTRHQQIHKDVRLFECNFCLKKFSQKTHLVTHLGTHTRKPFMCKLCGMIFQKEGNLTTHLFYDHADDPAASETYKRTIDPSSDIKPEELSSEEVDAMEKYNNGDNCSSQDGDSKEVYSSIERAAQLLIKSDCDGLPPEKYYRNIHYTCGTCGVVFIDFQTYIIHKKEHPTPKLFSCEQCGKGFTVKGNLQRHLQIHQDIRLHECDLCHKRFSQKTHLSAHMHVHSKERPFVCALCGGSFTREGNLRRHIKMHTNGKKELQELQTEKSPQIFKCEECFKTFMRKGNLKRHQKLHTRLISDAV